MAGERARSELRALVLIRTPHHSPLTTHHPPPTAQDPCAEEEALASCGFTVLLDAKVRVRVRVRVGVSPSPNPHPNPNVLLDAQGQFCALHKPGGAPLSPELIARSVAAAQQHMPAYVALCNGD